MILQFDEFNKYIIKVEKYCIKSKITKNNFDKKLDILEIENKMELFYNELEKIIKNLGNNDNYILLKKSYENTIKKDLEL